MTNITTDTNSGIVLNTKAYSNPVSIASGVSISNGVGVALVGQTQPWTVTNSGQIYSEKNAGVSLTVGGVLIDTSTGTITGTVGVVVSNPSTIKVAGSIGGLGATAVSFGAATGSNLLAVYSGAVFGGIVAGSSTGATTLEFASSASTGTVSGLGTSFTNFQTINVDAGSSWVVAGGNSVASSTTLTDSGTLTNTGTLAGVATLASGGVLTNALGGLVSGGADAVIGVASGVSVVNAGSMVASSSYAVSLAVGGTVSNAASGVLGGEGGIYNAVGAALTVTNAGTIAGSKGTGVENLGSGVVNNATSAVISGVIGIYFNGQGTVNNQGAIFGSGGGGVQLADTGSVTNSISGIISGSYGVYLFGSSSNLLNQGTIIATSAIGVRGIPSTRITNAASGTISSVGDGVSINSSGTVINAGTINSSTTNAIDFYGTGANLLVIDPGAYFGGKVSANVANTAGSNMIELAAGTTGGALSYLGNSFTNFGTINVDAGAVWSLTNTNNIETATLADAGTLTNAGTFIGRISLVGDGVLTNAAGASIYYASSAVLGTGTAADIYNAGMILGSSIIPGFAIELQEGGQITNTAEGSIGGSGGIVSDSKGGPATVVNSGVIIAGDTAGADFTGVYLKDGGLITNAQSGTIYGGQNGIYVAGAAATIQNQGTVASDPMMFGGYGIVLLGGGGLTNSSTGHISGHGGVGIGDTAASVLNAGTISAGPSSGVYSHKAGNVTNAAGGVISAAGVGVDFIGGGGTLRNAGAITSINTLAAYLGGSVANLLIIDPGAVFGGAVSGPASIDNVMELTSGSSSGTLAGLGGSFSNFATIEVDTAAQWTLATDQNTISSATLINAGTVFNAVTLGAEGVLTNASSGLITSTTGGVNAVGTGALVSNAGVITTTNYDGVALPNGGSISNLGTITGANGVSDGGSTPATVLNSGTIVGAGTTILSGYGVGLNGGGSITNATSGSIAGARFGVGLGLPSGTLLNSGTIAGAVGGALGIGNDTFSIAAGALISGGTIGIEFITGGNTVANAGTIAVTGPGTVALAFAGPTANLMVVDPGAVETGTVAASTSGLDTLELASRAASGSLSGLGVSFTNFGTIVVDASDAWQAYGYNTIASGVQLIDSGSLYVQSTLTNSGTIAGGIGVGSNGTLTNTAAGTITGAIGVKFANMNAVMSVENSGIIVGTAGQGIWLEGSSTVTNAAGGTISGASGGVEIDGAGTVYNSGTIMDADTAAAGVFSSSGGSIVNDAAGNISGGTGVYASGGGYNTLVNAGTIVGVGGTAVYLGGYSANQLVIDPGAVFTGIADAKASATNAIELASGASAGTITGLGSSFVNFQAVTVDAGANWTLAGVNSVSASGIMTDYGSLTNDGTLNATVTLGTGSTLSNGPGATIATTGVAVTGPQSYVSLTNGGVIESANTYGVKLGVFVSGGDYLSNQSGATISGAAGVYFGGPGSIRNFGVIVGTSAVGIDMARGGTLSSGGTIAGGNGTAAVLAGYGNNRLILDPGAVFLGTVAGGISATNNTMELSGGDGHGTVSGLGVSFTNFATVTVDSGAYWTLTGYSTVAASQTLLDDGILTNAGTIAGIVTLDVDGIVTNASGGAIASLTEAVLGTSTNASVVNAGLITAATVGVSLMSGGQITNLSGGIIEGTGEGGIVSGSPTLAATVVNDGTITGGFYGVTLSGGSTITNGSSGVISGYGFGVHGDIYTVFNAGSIVATGTDGVGVRFDEEIATMTNALSGVVTGQYGVELDAYQATLINAGTIAGAKGAVYLNGFADNRLVLQPGAVIDGSVEANASAANVLELGTPSTITGPTIGAVSGLGISFVNFGSITVDADANWTAIGDNTVAASVLLTDYGSLFVAGTLTNAGTIIGENTAGSAIVVTKSGTLTNTSTIENTVSLDGGVLVNALAGTISGHFAVDGGGVYASTVTNEGRIEGTFDGVDLGKGGLVTNAAGALIDGKSVGVLITGSAGTVANAGTITDSIDAGVAILSGGTVVNAAGALIAGRDGVIASGGLATVTNFGTIAGTTGEGVSLGSGGTVANYGTISGGKGTAVNFGGSATNLLVIDPAAIFDGKVAGGASATNNMELTTGASAGTISGIGSSFTNFATVTVDPSATWTFSSTNSLEPSGFVRDGGTLINTGALYAGQGVYVGGTAAAVVNVAGATISGGSIGVISYGATVVNYGTVSGGTAFGVGLISGGSLTNAAGASILDVDSGVFTDGPTQTVTNNGTIGGGLAGVYLHAGGAVTNAASASIYGVRDGVLVREMAGTVANAGTIVGETYYGVLLRNGGLVTNSAGGSVTGSYEGVDVTGGVGTVVNSGSISSANYGVSFTLGGAVTNASLAQISGGADGVSIEGGAGTVFNSATISGASNYGVYIGSASPTAAPGGGSGRHARVGGSTLSSGSAHHVKVGGSPVGVVSTLSALIVNAASATIFGSYNAVYVKDEIATIINEGTIAASLIAAGANTSAYGVFMNGGGSVTNGVSGLITGYSGVNITSNAVELVNYGTIIGTTNYGVYADVGSSIVNTAGGLITGSNEGVYLKDGTLTNAGTVVGGSGTAVAFYGSVGNLLVIDPGAVFGGIVAGSASSTNSMELASAAGAGTLVGLGVSFTSFGTVGVDAGASWHLGGGNTLAAGSTLTNAGTLTLDAGATLDDASTVVNNGAIVLTTSTSGLSVQALAGAGIVSIGAGSTADVQGTVATGESIDFAGGGNAFLVLNDGPAAAGTIGDFGVGDTIDVADLPFVSAQSTASVSGNVLTVTEGGTAFTFSTAGLADGAPVYALDDGDGGTDITLTPPSPSGMVLAPASDGGVKGDDITNVKLPTITGNTTPYGTVDLYQGGVLVGVGTADGSGAWSVTATTPLSEGANSFTSTVTDVAGHLSPVSAPPLTITLDTAIPAAPGTLMLATASDSAVVGDDITNVILPTVNGTSIPNGTIDLYDGTALIGAGTADNTGAWSITASTTLAVGANTLTATATDTAGNVSSASPALVVTLETAAVTPTSLTLDPGSDTGVPGDDLTNVALPAIDGTGAAGSTIDLYDAEDSLIGAGTVDSDGHWSVNVTAALASGANAITATATDVAGNVSGPSTPLVVTLDTVPPAPPTALTLAPASDSGVKGDELTNVALPVITGTAEPGSTIDLYDGEALIGVGTADSATGVWSVTATSPLVEGVNKLRATATDAAGNVSGSSSTLDVTLDTVLPAAPASLSLASVSDSGVAGDDLTNVTHPQITGTGVVGDLVTLYDGGTVIGTSTVTPAGTWSVTPIAAFADGQHTLSASQTDAAGNVSPRSGNLALTIQTGAATTPTLAETASITNPAEPVLVGTAEIGATVTIFDGTIALGSAIADGTGHFSFAVPDALSSGTHQLTAVADDIAGNLSAPSATLKVDVSANSGYAVVSAPDSSGVTVAHVYNTGGTLSAADTYDSGGLLLQYVGTDATIRNIYDSSGKLIGTVSGPGAADGIAPQPDFATNRLNKGAQTATDSGASVVNLLSESNNLSTQGNDTVLAGSGSTTVSANTNAVLVAGGSGSLVFAGGSGASTVLGGTGSSSVFGGSGGGVFQGGSAGHNVLVAGSGNTTLLGGGVGDLLLGSGNGQQLIMGNAAHQTLVGGGSSATLVGGGAGGNELFGGPGNSEMFASAGGADTLAAGSGNNIMVAKNGDVVFASAGASTIFGSATGNDVMVGGGTALMVGGNGNDMYSGGGGTSTIFSGAGNDTVFTGSGTTMAVLGAGADEVFLGSGVATVFAGGGKDIFATFAGQSGGSTTIAGFKVGTDVLGLSGYDLSAVTQKSANGATILTLADNTKITVLGINHLDGASLL